MNDADYQAWNTPRNVLEAACDVLHIVYDPEDPRGSLHRVICAEIAIALDPRVSEDARALYEKGRRDMLSEIICGTEQQEVDS